MGPSLLQRNRTRCGPAVHSSKVAARTNHSPRISGDVLDIDFWRVHSWELLDLIREAPTSRLKNIDLNKTERALNDYLLGLA